MRLLLSALWLCMIVCGVQHSAFPLDSLSAGELRLEGQVKRIDRDRITIAASAFVNPGGKKGQIRPPKTKVVVLPKTGTPANLKVGDRIIVAGRDGGEGKPLIAREIARSKAVAATSPAKPVPVQHPSVWPSAQRPMLEFKNGMSPEWKAGNMDIKVEKAGFDYPTHFLPPKTSAFEKTPVFYCILQVRGAAIQGDASKRFVVRRFVGPQHEFLQLPSMWMKDLPSEEDAARVILWSSHVNPNWEFMDMDLDTAFGDTSAGKADTELVIENVPLPREGAVPLHAQVTSSFGTRYRITEIHATKDHHWHLVVIHERPSKPHDLELSSFSYQADNLSDHGSLLWGKWAGATDEIFLTPYLAGDKIKRFTINFHEESRSMEKRDVISRQCIRFPLREFIQKNPPTLPDKPYSVLAQTQGGPITVRAEGGSVSFGKDKLGALIFAHGTPEDDQHELHWTLTKGLLRFPGQPDAKDIPLWTGSFMYLWHVDMTPKLDDETVQLVTFLTPPGVTRGDAELQFEGRVVLNTSFVSSFNLPKSNDYDPVPIRDNDEKTLVIQEIKRISPEDMMEFPYQMQHDWPSAGLMVVFTGNPLLGLSNANFKPRCLDAEDDQGRSLQLGTDFDNELYLVDSRTGAGATYVLLLPEPAADAKAIRIWLSTEEKSRDTRQQTIELKDIPLDSPK